MNNSTPEFRVLMRFLRDRTGMSARGLSEKAGLSLSYVSKMEKGDVTPTVEVFSKIISQLEVTAPEIVYLINIFAETELED